jgi:macrodomain Ter protein organizer (MatP/YcbG family)
MLITHMTRTTIDIDAAVLRRLKARKQREGKTLGKLVSELLAAALRETDAATVREFDWTARRMGARVDLADKEAVQRALEGR